MTCRGGGAKSALPPCGIFPLKFAVRSRVEFGDYLLYLVTLIGFCEELVLQDLFSNFLGAG